jgi:hypothetical protein
MVSARQPSTSLSLTKTEISEHKKEKWQDH